MTIYKIGGKDYELQSGTTMGGTGPEFYVNLVASDGETFEVFSDSYEPYNNEPEDHYAGNGMFWDETHKEEYDSSGHLTPAPNENAKKLTAEEWREYAASNLASHNFEYCKFPALTALADSELTRTLLKEVGDLMEDQYDTMLEAIIDERLPHLNYKLVLEVRTEPTDCLHIEVLNRQGRTIMMDNIFISEVQAEANSDAKECYAGDGLFRENPDTDGMDCDPKVNAREWAIKSSDNYVDSLIDNEYNLWWDDADDMIAEIRRFLDTHILKFYKEAADKVVGDNN